jgi:hypothetical protein
MAYVPFVKTQEEPVQLVVKSGAIVQAGDALGYSTGWVVANAYAVTGTTPTAIIPAQFISLESCVGDGVKTVNAVRKCVVVDQDAPFTADGPVYLYGVATVVPGSTLTQTRPTGAGYLKQVLGRALSTSELSIDIQPFKEICLFIPRSGYNAAATSAGVLPITLDAGWAGALWDAAEVSDHFMGRLPDNLVSVDEAKLLIDTTAATALDVDFTIVGTFANLSNALDAGTTLTAVSSGITTADNLVMEVSALGCFDTGLAFPGAIWAITVDPDGGTGVSIGFFMRLTVC